MEQLQPTTLDLVDTITTGEAGQEHVLWCTCICADVPYPNHIYMHVQ